MRQRLIYIDDDHELDRTLASTNLDEYEFIDFPMEQLDVRAVTLWREFHGATFWSRPLPGVFSLPSPFQHWQIATWGMKKTKNSLQLNFRAFNFRGFLQMQIINNCENFQNYSGSSR